MDRINRLVAQIYGYLVCLTAIIVMLLSIKGIVDAAFDLSDPLRASGGFSRFGGSLYSFEMYRMQARLQKAPGRTVATPMGPATLATTDSLSDSDLRRMYDDERDMHIGNSRFRATRTLVTSLLLMIFAVGLFYVHWRWLKGIAPASPVTTTTA